MLFVIVGAKGKLGRRLTSLVEEKGYSCFPCGREETDVLLNSRDWIPSNKPVTIINCAAMTNTRACEENRLKAFQDNVVMMQNLAALCDAMNFNSVYISTEAVFANNSPEALPDELASPCPLTWYGVTKRLGEMESILHGGNVIRLPVLVNEEDDSTVFGRLLNEMQEGNHIYASKICHSTPITYDEASESILRVVLEGANETNEIVHITGEKYLSVFQIMSLLGERSELDPSLVRELSHPKDEMKSILRFGGLASNITEPICSSLYE